MIKNIIGVIPQPVKKLLVPLESAIRRTRIFRNLERRYFVNRTPHKAILDYWSKPDDKGNSPEEYLPGTSKLGDRLSRFLLEIVGKYAHHNDSFLEIGCNVGRNLDYLYRDGYKKLEAIEISSEAVKLLKQTYPYLAANATIHNAPVENVIKKFGDGSFDVIFSVAVFYHIHTDSNWIFEEIARISGRYVITIETEYATTDWIHFPRNYKKVFQELNMKQVEEIDLRKLCFND